MNAKVPELDRWDTGRWTRRSVLVTLGGGALAAAFDVFGNPRPPTLPQCLGPGPAPHERIDAHVHIFNGTDLQIAGFLKTAVSNEYPEFAPLLHLIADPLQWFTWHFAPKAKQELEHLAHLIDARHGGKGFTADGVAGMRQRDRAETDAQYERFLLEQLQRRKVRTAVSNLLRRSKTAPPGLLLRLQRAPKTGPEARSLARAIDQATGVPVFDYLYPYFCYRYDNFLELVEQFTCRGSLPIDTFIALMLDFDEPLGQGHATASPIPDQVAVMSRISELSRGHLLVAAPYCPLKDAAHNGASLKNVTDAWTKPGFVGAKMYPPMGFSPFGNTNSRVEDALAAFYHECIQEDAVVIAHAGPSNCISAGSCLYPGPVGWRKALEHVLTTEKAPLRASLGHFGGPFDTKSQIQTWPECFLKLMSQPYGERLYADLAYANEVLDPTQRQYCITRLTGLLKGSVLADRLMYGTDWLMLGLESHWRDYEQCMQIVIQGAEQQSGIAGFSGRFFGINARACLDLSSNGSLARRNTMTL